MPITTLDQAALGRTEIYPFLKAASPTLVAYRPHSFAYSLGIPGAIAAPAGGVSGEALSQTAGPLPGYLRFHDGAGAVRNEVLKMVASASAQPGRLLLCDRLWHNSGLSVTSTASQTVNSVAFPARDENQSPLGLGVGLALEVVTATGVGAPTHTLTYTDSRGATGLTTIRADAFAASSAAGSFHRFAMANDLGVQSVQSYISSGTMTSGAITLVAYRVLASIPIAAAVANYAIDWLTGGAGRVIANGACPFFVFIPTTTTATQIQGDYQWTKG